jgi:hypothetical protein
MSKKDRITELEANLDASRQRISELEASLRTQTTDNIDVQGRLDELSTEEGLPGGQMKTFEKFVDSEIDRNLNSPEGRGRALAQVNGEEELARDLGNDHLDAIAHELGIHVDDLNLGAALEAIHKELLRIKNPGADTSPETGNALLSKGDSLAQAIQHNVAQAQHLSDELTRARALLGRVAGALQVGQWDADGTEILEKVQRWESLKHALRRRIRELRTLHETWRTESDDVLDIADELQALLARLMAPKDLAKWLDGKPSGVASPTVAALATIHAPTPLRPFTLTDLARLSNCARSANGGANTDELQWLPRTMAAIAASIVVSGEFVNLMNLVILPALTRLRAAEMESAMDDPT